VPDDRGQRTEQRGQRADDRLVKVEFGKKVVERILSILKKD
jgi:hypothetical protein